MLIGIDASALVKSQPTGVEVATRDLLWALIHQPGSDQFIFYSPVALAEEWTKFPHVSIQVLPPAKLWTQRVLGPAASQASLDLFWSPSYMLPLTFKGRGIVTIHGLEFAKFPLSYSFKNYLFSMATVWLAKFRAHHIIAVSQSVKNDLHRLFDVSLTRISVVYNAVSPLLLQRIQLASRQPQSTPYILAVGRIEPRKNTLRLVEAFGLIAKSHPSLELHLAGFVSNAAYHQKIIHTLAALGLTSRVQFLGHTNHAQLGNIYKNATVVALVSLDEGFGIPVLEGFAAGAPVVTSNTSATAEVAGDAAVLVNPQSSTDIARGLSEALTNPALVEDIIRKGHDQLTHFGWDKSAKHLLGIFHNINGFPGVPRQGEPRVGNSLGARAEELPKHGA